MILMNLVVKTAMLRVIVFLGSPITQITEQKMRQLAANARKNKLFIDFVTFGDAYEVNQKLFDSWRRIYPR
jgi:hypothetical protein